VAVAKGYPFCSPRPGRSSAAVPKASRSILAFSSRTLNLLTAVLVVLKVVLDAKFILGIG
jgi:hypothetical protein